MVKKKKNLSFNCNKTQNSIFDKTQIGTKVNSKRNKTQIVANSKI